MTNIKNITRFLGAHSYPDDEIYENLFFGRDKEIERIMRSVYSGGSAIIYGASGVGKTSLINSGLLPIIRKNGKLWPVRVSLRELDYNNGSLLSRIKDSITLTQKSHPGLVEITFPQDIEYKLSLPKWVNEIIVRRKTDNVLLPIAFLFDQFESVFDLPIDIINSLGSQQKKDDHQTLTVNKVLKDINILSDPSIDNKLFEEDFTYNKTSTPCVLISIVESELGKLDPITSTNSAFRNNLYRINGLSSETAKDVIKNLSDADDSTFKISFRSIKFELSDSLYSRVLENATGNNSDEVSPFFIQLFGAWIENWVINNQDILLKPALVPENIFPKEKFDVYLSNYYLETLESLDQEYNTPEPKLTKKNAAIVCQEKLLANGGELKFESRKNLDKDFPGIIDWLLEKRLVIEGQIGEHGEKLVRLAHWKLAQAIWKTLGKPEQIITPFQEEINQLIKEKENFIKINKKWKQNTKELGQLAVLIVLLSILILINQTRIIDNKKDEIVSKTNKIKQKDSKLKKLNDNINIEIKKKKNLENRSKSLEKIVEKSIYSLIEISTNYLDLSSEAVQSENLIKSLNHIESAKKNIMKASAIAKEMDNLSNKGKDDNNKSMSATNLVKRFSISTAVAEALSNQIIKKWSQTSFSNDGIGIVRTNWAGIKKYIVPSKETYTCLPKKHTKNIGSSLKQPTVIYYELNGKCAAVEPFIHNQNQATYSLFDKKYLPNNSITSNYDRLNNYFVLYHKSGDLIWGDLNSDPIKLRYYEIKKTVSFVSSVKILKVPASEDFPNLTVLVGNEYGELIKISLPLNTEGSRFSKLLESTEKIKTFGKISSIQTISQNDRTLILLSTRNELQIRDAISLKLISSFYIDASSIDTIAITKDNSKALVISNKNKIYSLDLPLKTPQLRTLKCSFNQPTAVAISPDLKTILVGGYKSRSIEKITYSFSDGHTHNHSCLDINTKDNKYFNIERINYSTEKNNINFKISGKVFGNKVGGIGEGKTNYNNEQIKTDFFQNSKAINSVNYDEQHQKWLATTFKPSIMIGENTFTGNPKQAFVSSFYLNKNEIAIALRGEQGRSCLWSSPVSQLKTKLSTITCNQKSGVLYRSDTKINWADINATGTAIAVVNNAGHLAIVDPTKKSFLIKAKTNEPRVVYKKTQQKIWKVKFFTPSEKLELIVTADLNGGLKFWQFTNTQPKAKLVLVYSINIPAKKYRRNLIQDMDIRCNAEDKCLLAVPVAGEVPDTKPALAINKTKIKNSIFLWEFNLKKALMGTKL